MNAKIHQRSTNSNIYNINIDQNDWNENIFNKAKITIYIIYIYTIIYILNITNISNIPFKKKNCIIPNSKIWILMCANIWYFAINYLSICNCYNY